MGRLTSLRPRVTFSRWTILLLGALIVVAIACYWVALRGSSSSTAEAGPARAVAQIGEGKRVLVVGSDGSLMGAAPGDSKESLPVLPLKERPEGPRVRGHVLEEVRVLAAAPKALRRYIEASGFAKSGIEVELASGIGLRFGDDRQADEKWKAVAAVLGNSQVTALGYVDVHAPTRPAIEGDEHELPPAS